ncbi:unnamed protein product, partial [Ectocarpus sp. 12 AP-2014]
PFLYTCDGYRPTGCANRARLSTCPSWLGTLSLWLGPAVHSRPWIAGEWFESSWRFWSIDAKVSVRIRKIDSCSICGCGVLSFTFYGLVFV